MTPPAYEKCVFVNCPFDPSYKKIFDAIIFAVFDCGYLPQCAREEDDGSRTRIDKIKELVRISKLSIHDLSRTQLDPGTRLPRFNMPFELGLFLGAKEYGSSRQRQKTCLIMDTERYRYPQFISDIAGQDVRNHNNNRDTAIIKVRNWLAQYSPDVIPGGDSMCRRYAAFLSALPKICRNLRVSQRKLTYRDYVIIVSDWLKKNPR